MPDIEKGTFTKLCHRTELKKAKPCRWRARRCAHLALIAKVSDIQKLSWDEAEGAACAHAFSFPQHLPIYPAHQLQRMHLHIAPCLRLVFLTLFYLAVFPCEHLPPNSFSLHDPLAWPGERSSPFISPCRLGVFLSIAAQTHQMPAM